MAKHYYTDGGSGQVVSELVRMLLDQKTNSGGNVRRRDPISEAIHGLKALKKIGLIPDDVMKKKEEDDKKKFKGEWVFKPESKPTTFTLRESMAMALLFGPFVGLGYLYVINMALNAIK